MTCSIKLLRKTSASPLEEPGQDQFDRSIEWLGTKFEF